LDGEPQTKPLSEEEEEQLREFEAQMRRNRVRTLVGVSARDLKWILYVTSALLMFSLYGFLFHSARDEQRMIVMMMAIVGFVGTSWGAVRGFLLSRAGGVHRIGAVYAVLFAMLASMFVMMALGLLGVFGKLSGYSWDGR
jgi:hypothetical protein